ncbi:sigma-54-dependent Fis family transcriptional regulator [Photobacterium damselae subsp. damselae]|uniref:sigma-54 interaction domain-containing protein n=1 Tax=Photobacterium damselae TaxID=38293 RepID=UPI00083B406A|nr:sigma-54 dependent transcriptional regulator [Photobacterium damselae]AWK81963.1 AAA family ATPase [Photobacterium damselae]QSH56157.1 sigma-54-dependent Fis family transcriptional regulator [Photobacterium damselae subsp. damselae]
MKQWLTYTAEMIECRKCSELITFFQNVSVEQLAVAQCLVFYPSDDGRFLISDNGSEQWEVDDFDHPFSHALHHAKPILLDSKKLHFWRQNSDFEHFSQQVSDDESLLVVPLPFQSHRVKAVVGLIGNKQIINNILNDENWLKFSQVFISQWILLRELASKHRQELQLNESITQLKSNKTNKGRRDLSHHLIGSSPVMESLREQIAIAAQSSLTVLIQGETGSGKELVAKAIHTLSDRKDKPFVAVNCAAIPENLLESELFGYEKGAFTGAISARKGLIAQADGGTLFLDEMGEMALALQAKLLRVLETLEYRPLGSNKELRSQFRLVAATHVNLRKNVNQGLFRQDLFYRLYQYPLDVPSLSNRLNDIDELAEVFIEQYNQRENRHVLGFDTQTLALLKTFEYPGNVRQLRSLVEYACVHTDSNQFINEQALPKTDMSSEKLVSSLPFEEIDDLKLALEEYERKIICDRLTFFAGDRAKAAESLGLPKRTLAHKCQKLEI